MYDKELMYEQSAIVLYESLLEYGGKQPLQ